MAKLVVTDELWAVVKPVLPERKPSPKGGQPPVDDRVCLTGILFVLKTGIGWEDFPQEMGCCGMTLWNRLKAWTDAGVWPRLHETLLAKLRGADQIDFTRVVVDSASVRAVFGGRRQAQIRPIGAKTARSTTTPSTPGASRWRRSSPAPTATT